MGIIGVWIYEGPSPPPYLLDVVFDPRLHEPTSPTLPYTEPNSAKGRNSRLRGPKVTGNEAKSRDNDKLSVGKDGWQLMLGYYTELGVLDVSVHCFKTGGRLTRRCCQIIFKRRICNWDEIKSTPVSYAIA